MTMNGPLTEAIGLAVLHLLWQGVVVAGLLAIALRLLMRSTANVRYGLSCCALATLVILGIVTAQQSYEPDASAAMTVSNLPAEPLLVLSEADPVEPGFFATATVMIRMHSSKIALVWLFGVVILASRLAFSWTRTRRLATSAAAPAPAEWQDVLARLSGAMKLRRIVTLVESSGVDVPSVIGFLKPVILVPASSLSGLSTRQLEMILAHELAHIRRHDYLVNMMQSVAETLLFFHPAAWWISHQIRIERENCCDDLAVGTCGNAVEYARALTMLEELRDRPALAVAANGGSLLDRVKRLVGHNERRVNGWTAVAAVLSFAIVMTITSLPLQADRDVPEPPAPPNVQVEVVAPPAPAPTPKPAVRVRPVITRAPVPPDYDIDLDVKMPEIPIPPGTPMPAIAPAAEVAMAAAVAAANFDFDLDFDYDDQASDRKIDDEGRLSVDELIALRIHDVTPEYIQQMRAVFPSLRIKELTGMKIMGVSPKYVADMRAAGVNITTAKEAINLRTFDVTPEFVRSLAAAGYTNLTIRELTKLAAAGVNADFIREMSKYREKK